MTINTDKLKLTMTVILIFSGLFILFRIIFYSTSLANTPQIINLRERYQNLLYSVIRMFQKDKQPIVFNPIYSFTVREWDGLYYYTFTGTLVQSDLENAILYLKSKDNKTYSFKVSKKFILSQEDFKLNNLGFEPKIERVDIDNLPLSENSQVKITWEDQRTLSKILSDYSENKERPLNVDSTLFFNIIKRK